MRQQPTFMNDIQIQRARQEGELVICPYSKENLTPVGYNLSFSRFIISNRRKAFVKIIHKNNEWFFFLKPFDSALILTRESIWVSKFIGGTFHSKVSMVTKGLGHVSTTLDPGWYGQLLVPINNPTKEKIKIVIAKDTESGIVYQTFITMILFRAQEAALNVNSDNKSARIELLEQILYDKRKNRDAQYLSNFINKLKNNIAQMEVFDNLNDPEDRRQKIKHFQQEHIKLVNEMDNEFETLNKFSKKNYNMRMGIFWGIVAVITIMLFGAGIIVFVFCGETVQMFYNLILAVVFPTIILVLTHFKDRFC